MAEVYIKLYQTEFQQRLDTEVLQDKSPRFVIMRRLAMEMTSAASPEVKDELLLHIEEDFEVKMKMYQTKLQQRLDEMTPEL
jgi:hypothetical protein